MKNVYVWGISGLTIDAPKIETLQHFLDRKENNGIATIDKNEHGARAYLTHYTNTVSVFMKWQIMDASEWEVYKLEAPYKDRASKGQLVLDMITLVSKMKGYTQHRHNQYQYQINDALIKHSDEVLFISTNDDKHQAVTDANALKTQVLQELQPKLLAWDNYFKNLDLYFTDLTLLVNGGLVDILPFERDTFVAVSEDMKSKEPTQYANLLKVIEIDEIVEGAVFTNKLEEITHMVEGNKFVSVPVQQWPVDPNAGKDTLAHELGNAHGGA